MPTFRARSLASTLAAAGYRTALFHSGRFMYLGMTSIIDRRGFDVMEDAGAIGGRVDSSFGVDDGSTVARVLRWIDSGDRHGAVLRHLPANLRTQPVRDQRSRPVSKRFGLLAIHERIARERCRTRRARSTGLRQRHLLDNTLIVVFGDHGEAFGEHPGNFAHTFFINEENVRIPLVIAAPGAIREPVRLSRLASVVDIAPTILDLLGLPAQPSAPGRIAATCRFTHGAVLHGLFDRLARSCRPMLEVSLRRRLEAISIVRCVQ